MLGKVFGIMCLVSVIFALITGNMGALGGAVLEGAEAALEVTLSLAGVMCLWGGIMQVLREAGAIELLAGLLSPLLRIFFPDAYSSGEGKEEIAACIGANLLGIGNAATPLALSATKKMHEWHVGRGGRREEASRDMITLAVLNTAAANLMPTTILALRRSAGATDVFSVVPPIWICSCASALFALLLTKALGGIKNNDSP